MVFVGEILKKSRLDQKIEIDQIVKDLNISTDLLIKIESDFFEDNNDLTYLVGHIRSYASYLELDADEVVKYFKKQIAYLNKEEEKIISKPINQKKYINNYSKYKLSSFAFISICLGFYLFFLDNNNSQTPITPDLPDNFQSKIEEYEVKIALENLDSNFEENEKENFFERKDQVIASIPLEEDLIAHDLIKLKFIDSTWLQVRDIENKVIISKLMPIEEEYIYQSNNQYSITTGNAGNILVYINDELRGKLGKKGEVKDSFFISSEFND